ncbi:MAG: MGMT family protein [Thermomicrobiales bacterium]
MPASIEFARKVYEVVAQIPPGRVTTYGRIAAHLGDRRGARMVGWALMDVPRELDLPCHRVVNRVGLLSGGWHFGHPEVMAGLLRAEGIAVTEEFTVDLTAHLWDPADALWTGPDGDELSEPDQAEN